MFPNISFLIISGNEDGIFDVTDHGDADEAGKENLFSIIRIFS